MEEYYVTQGDGDFLGNARLYTSFQGLYATGEAFLHTIFLNNVNCNFYRWMWFLAYSKAPWIYESSGVNTAYLP